MKNIPTTATPYPVAAPLMRLRKVRGGIIGAEWVEIVAIAPGSKNHEKFYNTTRYFCRYPVDDKLTCDWFPHSDLFCERLDEQEYEVVA